MTPPTSPTPNTVDVLDDDAARELRAGLTTRPRTIPPRWLYDARGSELFSEITRLDEYYPTEAERALLVDHAAAVAELTGATTLIELGAGTSDKTRTLLDALTAHGTIERFVPLDVSESALREAADALAERYPELVVEPVVGDFNRHLNRLPVNGTTLVAFLGGTIGNFYVDERRAFLGALADALAPGDWLLLGVDLVKPIDRLMAAYDDPHGVTEAFIRNSLVAINRAYDGNIDVGNFTYVPLWDAREERVDMRLRACEPERARLAALDLDLVVEPGEELRVEISTKFRPDRLDDELRQAGFDDVELLTGTGDFALVLARRAG